SIPGHPCGGVVVKQRKTTGCRRGRVPKNPSGPVGEMSQQELLAPVTRVLADAGIDYMMTGSVASGLPGEPRSTQDIDLVVAMPAAAIPHLLKAFPPPDYYLSEESVRDAIRGRSMFNSLSLADGNKI